MIRDAFLCTINILLVTKRIPIICSFIGGYHGEEGVKRLHLAETDLLFHEVEDPYTGEILHLGVGKNSRRY
jgi:hypothetical protein